MKVVALVSGGKDSCYAMMKCIQYGHQIVALANLLPLEDSVDELDSYMYQTVGHQIVVSYAECMGLPLFRRRIQGSTRHQKLSYRMTLGDEVEDMLILLSEVKRQIPSVSAVSSGAIASDYQRLRVESVCSRLGLVSLAYLWKQDQSMLLQEMISNKIAAVLVKVAAIGLDPAKHLGKDIMSLQQHLLKLKERYGSNVCGEGGEYETLTLDCPLFINARIVLDGFDVVLHSPDTIAPVGVLHPSAFHLEHKNEIPLASRKIGSIYEVQGDVVLPHKANCESRVSVSESILSTNTNLQISKTKHKNTFSLCSWISDPAEDSEGLQKDLSSILSRIESELAKDGFGWVNVLYIHLYIADMNEFLLANETYVSFITEDKCPLGVPSRSTIEVPLSQVGLGKAYVEVLVANDQSKQVLHVQSISSWAPSCIGPYSQATLHKGILYMAGQLGLDPPTMKLCHGGATAEVEQSLKNCEAVAMNFKCSSLSSSTILFTVYCSASLTHSQKVEMQSEIEAGTDKNPNLMFLYILAPDLPKSALVEIKPILYVPEDEDSYSDSDTMPHSSCTSFIRYWEDFEHVAITDSCIQKYVVQDKICMMTLSITNEQAANICGVDSNHGGAHDFSTAEQMKQISKFCIFLLDRTLGENYFSWEDVTSLRFYFPTYLGLSSNALYLIIADALEEFAEVSERIKIGTEPIFNIVPVLGAGRSATCMDDLITCEIFASKL